MPTCLAAAMMPTFNSSLDAGDNEDSLSINVDQVDSQSSLRDLYFILDFASDHRQENNERLPLCSDLSSQEPEAHSTDIDYGYDNSMTYHSYSDRYFDQIVSATEAQVNDNENDSDFRNVGQREIN